MAKINRDKFFLFFIDGFGRISQFRLLQVLEYSRPTPHTLFPVDVTPRDYQGSIYRPFFCFFFALFPFPFGQFLIE